MRRTALRFECALRPCPWIREHFSLASVGRVGSKLPTKSNPAWATSCPPYKNQLQPLPISFASPRMGSRRERRASQKGAGKSARTV